ncbi:MAG: NAD(P)H-binding protein [Chloroflexota bacterium]
MSSKILVTGAPGNVGTELVRLLAERGADVRVLAHHIERSGEVSHPGVEIIEGDLSDGATMSAALDGVDTFYLSSAARADLAFVQNAAIDTAAASGVRRIVKLSAYGVGRGAAVPFFTWHTEVEDKLRASGKPWTMLRPHLYMQTVLQNLPTIQAQGAIFNSGATSQIPMIDARDAAAAAAAVLLSDGHDGAVYELSGPALLPWAEVASTIGSVLGRQVTYMPVPAEGMAVALTGAGLPEWLVRSLVGLHAFYNADRAPVADTVAVLSGKAPRSLAEFVRNYAGAFSEPAGSRA